MSTRDIDTDHGDAMTDLALQSTKTQVWKGSYQDPIPLEFQDKVTLTLCCLGGHLQMHGDTEPSPVFLGEQATMEKTIQRFQKIATTLADLQRRWTQCAGSERSTHHVCGCSKSARPPHELRA